MPPDLLIIGASTRAAAFSALRGGLRPICVDLFGDADLRAVAEIVVAEDYPAGLPRLVEQIPDCPWMYTGGLENHSKTVARLAAARPLLGNGPDMLARIRDPWRLVSSLRAADLPALELWPAGGSIPPPDGGWLRKPIRSVGGRGIRIWGESGKRKAESRGLEGAGGGGIDVSSATSSIVGEPVYFQRRAVGTSYSALFVAEGIQPEGMNVEMLGVTRQWIGLSEVFAPPFAWCGSVTPVTLPQVVVDTMRRIGERLAVEAGLRGLFGCDFVVEENVPWLTEVNPRYTASMELLDYELRTSLVARHIAACSGPLPPPLARGKPGWGGTSIDVIGAPSTSRKPPSPAGTRAKLILFADRDLIAADTMSLSTDPRDDRLPQIADVPNPGQRLPAGTPICTLFAEEPTEEACLVQLLNRAHECRRSNLLKPASL